MGFSESACQLTLPPARCRRLLHTDPALVSFRTPPSARHLNSRQPSSSQLAASALLTSAAPCSPGALPSPSNDAAPGAATSLPSVSSPVFPASSRGASSPAASAASSSLLLPTSPARGASPSPPLSRLSSRTAAGSPAVPRGGGASPLGALAHVGPLPTLAPYPFDLAPAPDAPLLVPVAPGPAGAMRTRLAFFHETDALAAPASPAVAAALAEAVAAAAKQRAGRADGAVGAITTAGGDRRPVPSSSAGRGRCAL